ncbi:nucleotidyltransferase family protein [Lunatimonas salinarum]|uniref:nucleotidyltransferase family protein n=1 Tax=Lunatimonas salinarum TaxID=1774590 RepID=UPI001AE05758|nr:nucleotidyltransferase family protein [Lunatimonas salinarum]
MITEEQKNMIIEVLKPYSPKMIGIFGSFARGENQEDSDLDILVDFQRTVNLLDIIGAEIELSEILNMNVELVTKRAISPKLIPHIERDLKNIFYAEG